MQAGKSVNLDQLKSDRSDLYSKVKNQKQVLIDLKRDFKNKRDDINDMIEKRKDVQVEMQDKQHYLEDLKEIYQRMWNQHKNAQNKKTL